MELSIPQSPCLIISTVRNADVSHWAWWGPVVLFQVSIQFCSSELQFGWLWIYAFSWECFFIVIVDSNFYSLCSHSNNVYHTSSHILHELGWRYTKNKEHEHPAFGSRSWVWSCVESDKMNNDLGMGDILEEADTTKIPRKNTLKRLNALELHKLTLFQFKLQLMPVFFFLILISNRNRREMRLTLLLHM